MKQAAAACTNVASGAMLMNGLRALWCR